MRRDSVKMMALRLAPIFAISANPSSRAFSSDRLLVSMPMLLAQTANRRKLFDFAVERLRRNQWGIFRFRLATVAVDLGGQFVEVLVFKLLGFDQCPRPVASR